MNWMIKNQLKIKKADTNGLCGGQKKRVNR